MGSKKPSEKQSNEAKEESGGLMPSRRGVMKLTGGGLGAMAAGGSLLGTASAAGGNDIDCVQVDFVTGSTALDLDSSTYSGSSNRELVAYQWGEFAGSTDTTGEGQDRSTKTDNCTVGTTNAGDPTIDFNNGTASVDYEVTNCGGNTQDVMLVSYESSCNGASGGQFDPTNTRDQIVFDTDTDTVNGNDSGTLTVNIPPDGRVAHYRFDDPTPLADVSGGNDILSNNGATFTSNGGFYRDAYDFDGTDDNMTFPVVSADYSGSGDFTTSMWFNLDSLPSSDGSGAYLFWHPRRDSDVWLGIDDGGAGVGGDKIIYNTFGSSGNQAINSGVTPSTGQWTHVAIVSDTSEAGGAGQYKIYVNGTLESQTDLQNPNNPDQPNRIGAQEFVGRWYLDGRLDDIRMYDRALSTSEIEPLAT